MSSDLALFKEGITSLAPGAGIICYRDDLGNLQSRIEEGRLERNIAITVDYQNITGGRYSHGWEVDPILYGGLRTMGYKDTGDLVDKVDELAEE